MKQLKCSEIEMSNLGNEAKIREALRRLRDASCGFCHLILNSKYNAIYDKYKYAEVAEIRVAIANANEALAAPLRNCDVGTPQEQSVRMAEFCREQYKKTDGVSICSGCRFHNMEGLDCQFAWAQLPYEDAEGGAE